MTSKPSPWPPQPHRTLDEAPERGPVDEDMARRIAVIDEALDGGETGQAAHPSAQRRD